MMYTWSWQLKAHAATLISIPDLSQIKSFYLGQMWAVTSALCLLLIILTKWTGSRTKGNTSSARCRYPCQHYLIILVLFIFIILDLASQYLTAWRKQNDLFNCSSLLWYFDNKIPFPSRHNVCMHQEQSSKKWQLKSNRHGSKTSNYLINTEREFF